MNRKVKDVPSMMSGLFGSGRDFHFSINTKIELTEEIDGNLLAEAVEKARERYPYYYVHLVSSSDGDLTIADNPAPVTVVGGIKPLTLLSPECGEHIQMFCYEGNTLCHFIHHAFTDGRALNKYLQTVMYLYFSSKYHRDYDCPGVHLPGEKVLPEETSDPCLDILPEVEDLLESMKQGQQSPPAGYGWNSQYISPGKPTYFYMSVPEDSFIRYSKDNDSSPATLPAVFLLKAVYALHDDQKPVNAFILADRRAALGSPYYMGCCVNMVSVCYPPKVRSFDIEKMATITRGTVIYQTQDEIMRRKTVQSLVPAYRAISAESTEHSEEADADSEARGKASKERFLNVMAPKNADTNMSIGCSYAGPLKWGELSQYIASFYNIVYPSRSMTFQLSVNAINGRFFIGLVQNFPSDVYAKQMVRELEKEGIRCTLSPSQPVIYAKTADIDF